LSPDPGSASRERADTRAEAAETAGPPSDASPGRGCLYVVSTPIGNLGDVTLRSLEVLRAVPLVAAEDTRITRRLFGRHGITTHLVPHHARNEAASTPALLVHLRAGRDLALVTDAGTPLVSDPGAGLVAAWAAEGGLVVPIPGASAVLAALVASGIAGPRWSFEGFLPRRGPERRERLARLAADGRTAVLFEAPGRLAGTLADLAAACGVDRPAAVCRELTKLHEETLRGSLGALAAAAAAGAIDRRGEVVIVIGERPDDRRRSRPAGRAASVGVTEQQAEPPPAGPAAPADPLAAARTEVARLVGAGVARGEAARRVAAATGLPRRRLYDAPDAGSA
jgi:16S rRNA (cytidine1402-2'-O)-methyltransferase